jgi:hypothetical protein
MSSREIELVSGTAPAKLVEGNLEVVGTRDYCRMRIRDHARRTVEEAFQIGRYVSEARGTFHIKPGRANPRDEADLEARRSYQAWLAETCDGIMAPSWAEQMRLMYERQQRYKLDHGDHGLTIEGVMQALREADGASGSSAARRMRRRTRRKTGRRQAELMSPTCR